MIWHLSQRNSSTGRELADRHYNRQTPGAEHFVAPGACVVLETVCRRALWVTLCQREEYQDHQWAGAWVCSLFRNEGAGLSSDLIREAIAATQAVMGSPPPLGMVTFVDPGKVRRKRDPGRCFRRAGFEPVGSTSKRGLLVLQLLPEAMPEASAPIGWTGHLFAPTSHPRLDKSTALCIP